MNVPKLRFKEFNDEYNNVKLKEVAEIYDGTHETPNYIEQGVKFVSVENISNLLDTKKYISESDFDNYKVKPKYNDVFMTRIGNIGTSSIYKSDEKLAFYVSLALLRSKNSNILVPDYLNQYIKNNSFQKELHNKTIHVAFPQKINTGEIGECKINFCSDKEQIKIANFLSLLDKKIELQTKKIEDLKLFKKGLINILNKKSYQETTLGKIGKFQTSSIDKLVKENEKIVNLYNYMDVYKHKIIMTQDLSKLSKTSAKDNQIITNNLKRGDILFTPSSETPDDIGHSICIQENLPNTVYSYHLLRYRPNIIIDPLFSNYYFNNSKIRKQIIRYATGATRYTVSLDNFLKIKVDIPDLITQKKYGLLLYSTDKKVNKEMFKLNKLQELKKGLMQDMFV